MLSKKELDYVNLPMEKVPFPGKNYALTVAEKLEKAYGLYKKSYMDKEYDIIMSNGESLTLEILRRNLTHMLGIDFKRTQELLKRNGKKEAEKFNAILTLEYILDHIEEIIEYDGSNKERYLNYFKIMIKSTIFESFSDFSKFDFGIINFDKTHYNEDKHKKFNSKSSKLLFTSSTELITPYYVMGLKIDDCEKNYIVETMYAKEDMQELMENQELVIPSQILITNNVSNELTKLCATPKEKLEILKMYQQIILKSRIKANIDIMADYENMLTEENTTLKLKK